MNIGPVVYLKLQGRHFEITCTLNWSTNRHSFLRETVE
jgi:hypothetical protein